VFQTNVGKIGVYVCSDRHFPEGARALGLAGAEIVFNPSATVAGLSEYIWELEQPAHALANGYFVGSINRVGHEQRTVRILREERGSERDERSTELSELRVDDCQVVLAFDVGHVCDAEQTAYLVLRNLQRPG